MVEVVELTNFAKMAVTAQASTKQDYAVLSQYPRRGSISWTVFVNKRVVAGGHGLCHL